MQRIQQIIGETKSADDIKEDVCQFSIFPLNICLLYNMLIIPNPTPDIIAFIYIKIVYELLWKTKNESALAVYGLDLG
jgi:hypothetical protein